MSGHAWKVLEETKIRLEDAFEFVRKAGIVHCNLWKLGDFSKEYIFSLQNALQSILENKRHIKILEGSESHKNYPCQYLFSKAKLSGYVKITPPMLQNVSGFVYRRLLQNVNNLFPELNGIWVIARKLKPVDHVAYSYQADAYSTLSIKINIEVLILSPNPYNRLLCKVVSLNHSEMLCSLMSVFNVKIPCKYFPEDSYIKKNENNVNDLVLGDSGQVISVDQDIKILTVG